MTTLIVSNVISWLVIVILIMVVLALSRQIGVLHERIKPVGALSLGSVIEAGQAAPEFSLDSLSGGKIDIGKPQPKSQLLFFLSPNCPVCKSLIPILKAVSQQEASWLQLAFASDGVENDHVAYIKAQALGDYPYVLSTELGMAFQIGKLPYAVMIDPIGVISAHGLINNREHLDSLLLSKAA